MSGRRLGRAKKLSTYDSAIFMFRAPGFESGGSKHKNGGVIMVCLSESTIDCCVFSSALKLYL